LTHFREEEEEEDIVVVRMIADRHHGQHRDQIILYIHETVGFLVV